MVGVGGEEVGCSGAVLDPSLHLHPLAAEI